MEFKINKFGVGIEISLGTDITSPNTSCPPQPYTYPKKHTYWFRVNFGSWKKINTNVMCFNSKISSFNNKGDLLKFLTEY